MVKESDLQKQRSLIEIELNALKGFRDTPQLKKFRRQLQGELSFIKNELRRLTESKQEKELQRLERLEKANRNRSSKNKRVWNYVKSIQVNYRPDLSLKEIRSMLKKHRLGLETDIPDVAWKNPSP